MPRPSTATRRNSTFDARWFQVLDAAAVVFSDEGYDKASMRQIAAVSGLSLAGIYHYFSGKEELLYWIQYNTFDSLLKGLEESLEGVEDPTARLHTAVANHVRHFGENMYQLKVCARELQALEGDAYSDVHERRRAYFSAMHDIVRDLQAGEAPLDSWLATANLFGMLNWFYQWYDPERSRVSLDVLAEQQTLLFLGGIATAASSKDTRGDA